MHDDYRIYEKPQSARDDDLDIILNIQTIASAIGKLNSYADGYAAFASGLAEQLAAHAGGLNSRTAQACVKHFSEIMNYDDLRKGMDPDDFDGYYADTIGEAVGIVEGSE